MLSGIGKKKPKPKEEEPKFEIVEPKFEIVEPKEEDTGVDDAYLPGGSMFLSDGAIKECYDVALGLLDDNVDNNHIDAIVARAETAFFPAPMGSRQDIVEYLSHAVITGVITQPKKDYFTKPSTVSSEPDRSEEEDIEEVIEEELIARRPDADDEEVTSEEEQWESFLRDDFVRAAYEATLKAITDKPGKNHKNAITERVMDKSMQFGSMVWDCLDYGIWSGDLEMTKTNYYKKVERPVKEGVPKAKKVYKNAEVAKKAYIPILDEEAKIVKKKKKGGFKTRPDPLDQKIPPQKPEPTLTPPQKCAQCGVRKGKKHKKDCVSHLTNLRDGDVTKTEGMKKLIEKVTNGFVEAEEFARSLMSAYAGAKNAISGEKVLMPEWNAVSEEGQKLFITMCEILFEEYHIRSK